MIQFFKRLWRNTPIATLVFAVSLIVAGGFAVRSIAFWVYWNDPEHRAQAIEPWMTPKYIAHSWAVPNSVVLEALGGFERTKKGPMSLEQIANTQGVAPESLILPIETAIQHFNAMRPAPPKPNPRKPVPKDGT